MAIIKSLLGGFESQKQLTEERRFYRKIDEHLVFVKSEPLTLGVECELALLNAETLEPAHKGLELIAQLASPHIKKELFEHMVEVTSAIGGTVHEIETQLKLELEKLAAACEPLGLLITGTGYPPTIRRTLMRPVPDGRYERLQGERKILNERFGTLGMHIHLGMADTEQCVRFHNLFMHFVPHLIALSASSPFEEGVDTGLMSIRPTCAEALPIGGMPYSFKTWQEILNSLQSDVPRGFYPASQGSLVGCAFLSKLRNSGNPHLRPTRIVCGGFGFGCLRPRIGPLVSEGPRMAGRNAASARVAATREQMARDALWSAGRIGYKQSGRNAAYHTTTSSCGWSAFNHMSNFVIMEAISKY